ncbi:HNH endonuclease [Salmonella enterica]|nr:HNH endonuclease [Salmonella enterica]EBM4432574.1 HNH endonuclease [Salmonella enterica]ECS5287914.1 HNH endonuclease [Salmonella enterica]EEE1373771.1 HNH endonuclease [Salmonella enterica subsp. enterica serovar Durban]
MNKYLPSRKYLHECFSYNDNTGMLYWRKRPVSHFIRGFSYKGWNLCHAGKEVNSLSNRKGKLQYYKVGLNGTSYQVHRIIFKMFYDEEPESIDHIDGNGLNNRISNLQRATPLTNSRNMRRFKTNKSGITGVSWNKGTGKWRACISIKGKTRCLGYYASIHDAKDAYLKAKERYGFHKLHGEAKE